MLDVIIFSVIKVLCGTDIEYPFDHRAPMIAGELV